MHKIPHFATITAVAFALAAAPALARTLVWNTSVATSSSSPAMLSAAANWLENGEPATTGPAPGDRLEIGGSANVYFGAETFDFGSAGLTIYHTKKIYLKTVFTGSGVLTFDGSNVERVFTSSTSSSHTGGTVIKSGYSKVNAPGNPFGTGPVTLYQAASNRPRLEATGNPRTLDNVFVLHGDDSIAEWTPFDTAMPFQLCSITSDHDFTINCSDRAFYVTNGISAPGKTVTFSVRCTTSSSSYKDTDISGEFDANIVVKAYTENAANRSMVRFYGKSTVASNTLTVASGTNMLTSASCWAGTNITVGATATLQLNAAGNLSEKAHIAVEEGGRIKFGNAVIVKVAALSVGDSALPAGIYGASDLPGTIEGSGSLFVAGGDGGVFEWTNGNGTHVWSEPGNWDKNEVPGTGAVLYFPSAVSAANAVTNNDVAVDIGSAGMTLFVGATVEAQLAFTGSGALNITGSGRLNLRKVCTHSGGTRLSGSAVLAPYKTASPLGTEGTITIDGSGGGNPYLLIPTYNTTIPNDIAILGVITNRGYSANGTTSYGAIQLASTATFGGNITGDDDILLFNRQGIMTFNGSISVPAGKTFRLWNTSSGNNLRVIAANGTLTGNLSVEGTYPTKLGRNATCSGDVSVASTATLQLTAGANLSEEAILSVEDGGVIDIASGVRVVVKDFYVGGVQQPQGLYTAENLPGTISGGGKLWIGPNKATVIVIK